MASTWIRPLHVRKDRTILQSIIGRTGYAMDHEKTEGGELVVGYACDPRTVDEEFLLAKRKYEYITGRNQGNRDVILYHIRQSFKPGEITPQEAQEVGYELAMRWTKGNHAFIVAVHTDRAHIHCAIVYNSTTLDCTRKFKNFKNSTFAVRRLSDLICAEHGLSMIENPKPSKGQNYGKWLGDKKEPNWSETIKSKIDEVLPSCQSFGDFLSALKAAGFTVDDKRKKISVRAPGQKRPWRLDTLKGDYTETAIRERLIGRRIVKTSGDGGQRDTAPNTRFAVTQSTSDGGHVRVSLLVDIQAKIREGRGAGYEQWAKIFNLKQAAKTLVFLQENGIDSYEDLKKKSSSSSGEVAGRMAKIKEIETRQKEITELQKYIGQYGKTRDIYAAYKASGWSRSFYDANAADIILHRAAKKYFDTLGKKKLPSINALKQEYATLAADKKRLYSGYQELKASSRALTIAKGNADRILGITPDAQTRNTKREQPRDQSHGDR